MLSADDRPPPPHAEPAQKRFRFSLKVLLIVTTFVAVAAGTVMAFGSRRVLQSGPGVVCGVTMYGIVLPLLLVLAVYGRGRHQTFSMAALLSGVLMSQHLSFFSFASTCWWFLLAGLSGCVAIWGRRFIEQKGWDVP